jgi:hypothetical protein
MDAGESIMARNWCIQETDKGHRHGQFAGRHSAELTASHGILRKILCIDNRSSL